MGVLEVLAPQGVGFYLEAGMVLQVAAGLGVSGDATLINRGNDEWQAQVTPAIDLAAFDGGPQGSIQSPLGDQLLAAGAGMAGGFAVDAGL